MSHSEHTERFSLWLDEHMRQGKRNIPARLVTLLGLLERLRHTPTLSLESHRAPSGMQLIEHNASVNTALARFKVESPVAEKGRRANNLNAWAQPLFDWLGKTEFDSINPTQRDEFITALQSVASQRLVTINEDKPLIVRYSLGTAVAVITDILDQAQAKKRAKDVAEYLVGAKLELRFGDGIVKPKNVNTPSLDKLADFRLGNTAIEVTTVERADKSHLDQVAGILKNTGLQVWLLTRLADRERWQNAIDALFESQAPRIVITDIETFVGQNITEIGKFVADDIKEALVRLFDRYMTVWLPATGAGGLRITNPETLID